MVAMVKRGQNADFICLCMPEFFPNILQACNNISHMNIWYNNVIGLPSYCGIFMILSLEGYRLKIGFIS